MQLSRFRYLVLASAMAAFWADGSVVAAPYKVKNNHDSGPGSLRAAILSANASGGEIEFIHKVKGRIELLSALPGFAANITITGPGAEMLTVSGGQACRIFSMNAGTTNTVSGLTIADGMAAAYPNYTF